MALQNDTNKKKKNFTWNNPFVFHFMGSELIMNWKDVESSCFMKIMGKMMRSADLNCMHIF